MNTLNLNNIVVIMSMVLSIHSSGQFVHDDIAPEFRFGSLKYNVEFKPSFELHPKIPNPGESVIVILEDSLTLDTLFRINRKSNELMTFEQKGQVIYSFYQKSLPLDSCIQIFEDKYEYYTLLCNDGYLISDEFSMRKMRFDSAGICCAYDIKYKSSNRQGKSIFYNDSIQIFEDNILNFTIYHDNVGNIDSISDNYSKIQFSKIVFKRHPFYKLLTIEEYTFNRKSRSDVIYETETLTYNKENNLSYIVNNCGLKSKMWFEIYDYRYLNSGFIDCTRKTPYSNKVAHYILESNHN